MKRKTLLTLSLLFALYYTSLAQKTFDDDIDDENSPNEVPADNGLAWLIAGAAAYGLKKYRDQKETLAIQEEYNKRSK